MEQLIQQAITEKRMVEFDCDGYHRVGEPYVYGTLEGNLQLLIYQTAGESSRGPASLPGWRRVSLYRIRDFKVLDGHFAGDHPPPQHELDEFHDRYAEVAADVS